MTWWMYALLAALLWGVYYPLLDRAMTVISPITAYWIPMSIMILGLPFVYKQLLSDLQATWNATLGVKLSVILIPIIGLIATYSVFKSIQMSNATYTSLIEIAYPIFVAIFAYLLFQENHLSWQIVLGGAFILTGTMLVIISS